MSKTLDTMKKASGVITYEAMMELQNDFNAAVEKLGAACKAYTDDLDSRRAALDKQAAEFGKQSAALQEKREELAAKIKDLSSRGELDEAATLDAELEAIIAHIGNLDRKKKLADSATLQGDQALHEAMEAAYSAAEDEAEKWSHEMNELYDIVEKELVAFDKVERAIVNRIARGPGIMYAADQLYSKAHNHSQGM